MVAKALEKPVEANFESSSPILDPVLERIAFCESKNVPTAKNPNSSASGRFQFLTSSWNHYGKELWGESLSEKNIFSYQDNTELAYYVAKTYGYSDWNASKLCWY